MTKVDPPRKNSVAMSVLFTIVLLVFIGQTESQTTPPATPCSASTTCDSCVQSSKCLWCYTNDTCTEYPVSHLLPRSAECPLSQARWGVCWVNFEALIIAISMLVGSTLIVIAVCCCWCCCCCKRCRSGPEQDEEQFARRREEIKQRAEERSGERKTRHEDIRKKYGLVGDSDQPYRKFENE